MSEINGIFELCISGWETYYPVWFSKDCSEKEFHKDVKKAMDEILPSFLGDDHFIHGFELIDKIQEILLKYGYEVVKPSVRIDLGGECYYDAGDSRPSVITVKNWKAILKHNKKIDEEMFEQKSVEKKGKK